LIRIAITTIVLILLCLNFISCSDNQVAAPSKDEYPEFIYPLEIGNTWTYLYQYHEEHFVLDLSGLHSHTYDIKGKHIWTIQSSEVVDKKTIKYYCSISKGDTINDDGAKSFIKHSSSFLISCTPSYIYTEWIREMKLAANQEEYVSRRRLTPSDTLSYMLIEAPLGSVTYVSNIGLINYSNIRYFASIDAGSKKYTESLDLMDYSFK
jgi:hypothetical protein